MLTNNYWNLIAGMSNMTFVWSNDLDAMEDIGLTDTDGNTLLINPHTTNDYGSSADIVANWCSRSKISAIIGSGDTAPDATDYCLESDITSSFSNYSVSTVTSGDGTRVSTVMIISGTNGTSSALTIHEIGVVKEITTTTNNNYNHIKKNMLIVRHVLSSPRTVQPGESFIQPYEWVEN